jgi:beta-catenin-like protein 1
MSGAIDTLLQQLAYYKRHEPTSAEEEELMENLFDCVCSLLLHPPNRDLFLKGEGLQLMNLMLREKKASRNGALKVLDYALVGAEGVDCCQKFVDILGNISGLIKESWERNDKNRCLHYFFS